MHAPGRENNLEFRKSETPTAKKERPDQTGYKRTLASGADFHKVDSIIVDWSVPADLPYLGNARQRLGLRLSSTVFCLGT